jgi:hypothetical protein
VEECYKIFNFAKTIYDKTLKISHFETRISIMKSKCT